MKKLITALSLLTLLCPAHPSRAAPASREVLLEELVISANKIRTPAEQNTTTVHVVSQEELEAARAHTLEEALGQAPGVYSTTPGGPAMLNRTHIRGAHNDYTQIRLNDFPLRDPTAISGNFSPFQSSLLLPSGSLERLEVLKNAQSTLYGSNAMGGVISLFPAKTWESGNQTDLSLSWGSFSTLEGSARLAWGDERNYLNFTPVYVKSDGFKDIWSEQKAFSLGAGRRLEGGGEMEVNLYHTDSRFANYDSPEIPFGSDSVYPQKAVTEPGNSTDNVFTLAGLTYSLSPMEGWDARLKAAYSRSDRTRKDNVDFPYPSSGITAYKGENWYAEWLNTLSSMEIFTLILGADYENQRMEQSNYDNYSLGGLGFTRASLQSESFFAKGLIRLLDGKLNFDLGGRYNLYDHFDGAFIHSLGAAYLFDCDLRLYANSGAGYRVPTAFEMYGINVWTNQKVGNPDLKPEESLSHEIGIEQKLLDKRLVLNAAYFYTDFKNKIGSVAWGTPYYNKDKIRSQGVELTAAFSPLEEITLNLAYVQSKSEEPGNSGWVKTMKHLPERRFSGSLTARPLKCLTLYLGGRWQDQAEITVFDNNIFSTTTLSENGFFTMDLAVTCDVNEHLGFFFKINNLLDKKYTLEYNEMPGANFSLGVRASF
ncbi:MAG: TonB-dependent receptor [Desulfovibrionaceae bacterium]|nr:TonB-dependent receptor [Desulfovibrionaceae bacterium]